jgi:hypothetical protein
MESLSQYLSNEYKCYGVSIEFLFILMTKVDLRPKGLKDWFSQAVSQFSVSDLHVWTLALVICLSFNIWSHNIEFLQMAIGGLTYIISPIRAWLPSIYGSLIFHLMLVWIFSFSCDNFNVICETSGTTWPCLKALCDLQLPLFAPVWVANPLW